MHRSGIKATKEVKSEISANKGDKTCLFIKIEINKEAFVLKSTGKMGGEKVDKSDFKALQSQLETNTACYLFFRDCIVGNEGKWVLCQFMPDLARVNSKMLYASSRASVKEAFGNSALTEDYFISDPSELTMDAFEKSRQAVDRKTLLTFEEQAKDEAVRGEILAMSDGVALTVSDIPITVSKSGEDAIKAVGSGSNNVAILHLNDESQELLADTKGTRKKSGMDDVQKVCVAAKKPRYVLIRYPHKAPSGDAKEAMIFIYYCPDEAHPRLKMMYSTCKAMVLSVVEKLKVQVTKRYEASEGNELTDQMVMAELYPKKAEKVTFAKPKAKSKGRRKLISKKKFVAS